MGRFYEQLQAQNDHGRFACAGLDPVEAKMSRNGLWQYRLEELIDIAAPHAAAFKPNWAFYLERVSEGGLALLERVCRRIRQVSPGAVLIIDMKCADIGTTNLGYANWAFDVCGADAITVHSYMGSEAMQPIIGREDRGAIVLCKTSNPGSAEMQDVVLEDGRRYYEYVADTVSETWNENDNCALVVGATYARQLAGIRARAPQLPLLIPGIGTQGGDLAGSVRAAFPGGARSAPIVINNSSGFMYKPTFAESAAQLIVINEGVRAVLAAP